MFRNLKVKLLENYDGLPPPKYETRGAAGFDLRAAMPGRVLFVPSGERAFVPVGIALHIPDGFEGQVRPRSGLARKHGITMLNSPGTIDSDYRDEIGVILYNSGKEEFKLCYDLC